MVVDAGSLDAELAYVALTRQSDDLHVFAHEVAVGAELADLSRAMQRTRRQELAIEVEQQLHQHARAEQVGLSIRQEINM